jgi:phage FluMu gp28-like protein
MSAILPCLKIDSDATLAKHFMPHQLHWIQAEEPLHAKGLRAVALAEKSVRIGWTYADGFKNVRKRLQFKCRDYLFATKDWPSSLEYMAQVYRFAELFNLTGTIVSRGEDSLKVDRLDSDLRATGFTDQVKIGYIKFDNGSRIIAFSAHPQAMAVYGGDVGLDEFAKHPQAKLLWQTAQGRVTWAGDIAVWSSHEGEDTLFNQFAQEARAGKGPWNLYYRVTMPDAIKLGLVDAINRTHGTHFTPKQFLADCRARAGSEEIFEQSYMCNPLGADTAAIVGWSAIERCRSDYQIERVHLESSQVLERFGQFNPGADETRERQIHDFLRSSFPKLLAAPKQSEGGSLGFDVAASGQGDLAVIYIDEPKNSQLWLRALLTARTEDWHFLKTTLFYFLQQLPSLQAAGDESGLGRQICWEANSQFCSRFLKVNFAAKKHDLGFALMNQLSIAEKRFPRCEPDVATDLFALRKVYTGTKWVFTEGRNSYNLASHCDIAWAAALSTYAHSENRW